jgi:peroxiredoxin
MQSNLKDMKGKVLSFILFLSLLISPVVAKDAYNIKVKIAGLSNTECYWGYHFGEKQYVADTVKVDANGNMVFRGEKALDGGIYLIIIPSKKYFEVIIASDTEFSLETDTTDFINKMVVKGSKENEAFYDYLKFINAKQKKLESYKARMDANKTNNDSTEALKAKMTQLDEEVKDYKLNVMKNKSDLFIAKIFKTSQDPELPETPTLPNGRKDSTFAYRYYKNHFFDNVDFSDARLLRTPILHNKIKTYLENLTYQIPDSVIVSARYIIEKSKANKEVFKYCVITLTSQYEISKIMGMDAVFVALAEDYYKTGQAYWADSVTVFKITDRARVLKPLLLGKKAPNLIMADTSNKAQELWAIKSKYTILCFWDPDCGHCKKTVPKIAEWYHQNKDKNVTVYAVCTETEKDKWKKFIREHNLSWINVADMELRNPFRAHYDISSTPVIYMLDENKVIFAKKIGAEQIGEVLDNQIKREEALKKMKN